MFDRSLVTSRFDTETLISEKYLTYLLLAQVEAGLLRLVFDVVDVATNTNMTVKLHPPADSDYQRLYPSPDVQLPDPTLNSFRMQLVPGESSPFADVAFAPDGKHLLTLSADNMVRVWDLEDRAQDVAAAFAVNPAIGSAFNATCTQIATASADRTIRIWDLAGKSIVTTLIGHTNAVYSVAFSSDGTKLASGSFDQTLRIWDLATGTAIHTLTGHVGRVTSVAFNHAGTQVVSGGEDGALRVWDVQAGAPIAVLQGHTGAVNCVVFSPNDLQIGSGSDDKTVRLWDPATGTNVRTFNGHSDGVLWVDIGVNGTRLLSGSRDHTLKLWSSNLGSAIATIGDHRSDVNRVRFGSSTGRNASVSTGGSIRLWEDIFTFPPRIVEIRLDFMRTEVFVTIIDHNNNDDVTEGTVMALTYLAIYADKTSNGLETNHKLRLSFGRLDPGTKALLVAQHIDVALVEKTLRKELDRDLPLGIAQGQQVQQIRMRKFFDPNDGHRTLGIYVDLALRKGPGNEFVPARGLVDLAQDFRKLGKDIAFATSPGLFALLGPDAKFQHAEKRPGSDDYHYPLRKDMSDPESDEIGSIDSISIGPRMVPSGPDGPLVPSGQLAVDVDATYEDSTPDVGFTASFYFNPKRNDVGIVEWETDVNVDLGLLATLLLVVASLVFLVPFLPVGIGFLLLQGVAEYYASKALAEETDEESQASVLDSLPFRLPAAFRRWDPFYVTLYQVVAKLDEPVVIDQRGIAFTAEDLVLDKQPVPQADTEPVGELRDLNGVSAIRYNVPDFQTFAGDFQASGPGVDRLDFVRDNPSGEPTVVTLTIDQILERKAPPKHKRILPLIVLDAQRIFVDGGQIDQLLCTTWRVRSQQRDRLIGDFERNERQAINANEFADIIQDVTDDLTSGGHTPTQDEIAKAVELRVQKLIAERLEDYKENDLRDDLHVALVPLLRFDLAPEELVALQQKGIFTLEGKEIIVRHNRNGTETPYYRDHPDGDPRDNLLTLPHYSFPYIPPP